MNWFHRFMVGRYGSDSLTIALLVLYFIVMLIAGLFQLFILELLGIALILWACFRMLSRNIPKRRKENEWFLRTFAPVIAWVKNASIRAQGSAMRRQQKAAKKAAEKAERKNFCHFTCEQCGQILRVPRGKGKIRIHCPKCGHEFIANS